MIFSESIGAGFLDWPAPNPGYRADERLYLCILLATMQFRTTLIKHEQVLLAQSQQSAACNAAHTIEARLSRWLLRCRDLVGGEDLSLTQEFIAQMLGVRRTSVSIVANTMQQAGLIKYKRGHISARSIWRR
jgi:CRP-like cAMP-binding protein